MPIDELEATREAAQRYIERGGWGAKTELASEAGCSTDTIDRLLEGKPIVSPTYVRVRSMLRERGLLVSDLVARETITPYGPATVPLDYRCQECHEMTPGPPGAKCCMHCGASLGADCPKCGNWNRPKANLCDSCGHPLTEEGVRIKLDIQRTIEPTKDRLKREDAEKQARKRIRKAKGEPEL